VLDSAVATRARKDRRSEAHLVRDLSKMVDALDQAGPRQKINQPVPRVVLPGLFRIVRENHRQDVALDPRCRHVLPDVSALALVNRGRVAALAVQDDLGAVFEHCELPDVEVGLARSLALQLAPSTEPNDCHAA
jgi:hypothetical protein